MIGMVWYEYSYLWVGMAMGRDGCWPKKQR